MRGIDLHVARGSWVGIAGRNDADKPTPGDRHRVGSGPGHVTLTGCAATCWPEYHRRLGFLSAADRGLYGRFSVRGLLGYARGSRSSQLRG